MEARLLSKAGGLVLVTVDAGVGVIVAPDIVEGVSPDCGLFDVMISVSVAPIGFFGKQVVWQSGDGD